VCGESRTHGFEVGAGSAMTPPTITGRRQSYGIPIFDY